MSKLFNVFAAILLIVGSCFVVSDSYAKVCFLGEDCGSGGNFGDHKDMDPESECMKLNPNYWEKDECNNEVGMYMSEYCPFSSKYGICCSLENKHDKCIYPLKKSGNACGGKYKCVCDRAAYKYTVEECAKSNARIGGAACSEEVLATDSNGNVSNALTTNTYYSECRCDRGLYPYYTGDEADGHGMHCEDNADKGEACTEYSAGKEGKTYYATCACNTDTYKYTAAGCLPYQADDDSGRCFSGGTWYYEQCKSCAAYPAKNLQFVAKEGGPAAIPCKEGNTPGVDCDYTTCPYRVDGGKEYRIYRCNEPGYRVSVEGDDDPDNPNGEKLVAGQKCVPIECRDAVLAFVKNNTGYALLDEDGVLKNGNGNKVTGSKTPILADGLVEVTKESTNTTKQGTTTEWDHTCTHAECVVSYTSLPDYANYKCPEEGCPCKNADNCYCGGSECYSNVHVGNDHLCCASWNTGYVSNECHDWSGNYTKPNGIIKCKNYTSTPRTVSVTQGVYIGLNNIESNTYYAASYLANNGTGESDLKKAMRVACKKNPTVKYTADFFPTKSDTKYEGQSLPTISFYGVNLEFPNSTTTVRALSMTNAKLSIGGTLTTTKKVSLNKNSSNYNSSNSVVDITGTWNVKDYLYSAYYDFNPSAKGKGTLGMFISSSASSKNMADIHLDSGGKYQVNTTYVTGLSSINETNAADSNCKSISGSDHSPSCYFVGTKSGTTEYNAYVNFRGKSNQESDYADVYTNVYIGYGKIGNTVYGGRKLSVQLYGAINWKLLDGSEKINLAPLCSINANNFNSGYYPRILKGSGANGEWKTCSMDDKQLFTESWKNNNHNNSCCDAWFMCAKTSACSRGAVGWYNDHYVVAGIDKNGATYSTYTGHMKTAHQGECLPFSSDLDWTCPTRKVSFIGGKFVIYATTYRGESFDKLEHTPISCSTN